MFPLHFSMQSMGLRLVVLITEITAINLPEISVVNLPVIEQQVLTTQLYCKPDSLYLEYERFTIMSDY